MCLHALTYSQGCEKGRATAIAEDLLGQQQEGEEVVGVPAQTDTHCSVCVRMLPGAWPCCSMQALADEVTREQNTVGASVHALQACNGPHTTKNTRTCSNTHTHTPTQQRAPRGTPRPQRDFACRRLQYTREAFFGGGACCNKPLGPSRKQGGAQLGL